MYTVSLSNLFHVFNLQKKRGILRHQQMILKTVALTYFSSLSYVFPLGCFIVMEVILIEQ